MPSQFIAPVPPASCVFSPPPFLSPVPPFFPHFEPSISPPSSASGTSLSFRSPAVCFFFFFLLFRPFGSVLVFPLSRLVFAPRSRTQTRGDGLSELFRSLVHYHCFFSCFLLFECYACRARKTDRRPRQEQSCWLSLQLVHLRVARGDGAASVGGGVGAVCTSGGIIPFRVPPQGGWWRIAARKGMSSFPHGVCSPPRLTFVFAGGTNVRGLRGPIIVPTGGYGELRYDW